MREIQEVNLPGSQANKVVVVTGAAQGIGSVTARLLAERGATVIMADINLDGATQAARHIVADGLRAFPAGFDLTDEAQVAQAVRDIAARHQRIDVIFNNAALQTEAQRARDLDVVHMDTAAWDAAMAVNVRGPMLLCKHAIPVMIAGGGGSIIHSSSGFGLLGESTLTAYGASKAALINLSRFIATQYGRQSVRSNVIAIGFVLSANADATVPQPVKDVLLAHHLNPGFGEPIDVARVVAFLASEESRFINGALIPVDGGFTAHQPTMVDLRRMFEAAGSAQL